MPRPDAWLTLARRASRRLIRDCRGVALVEGAIISSFMVFVLFGMLELVAYFTAAVKVTEAADGVANIVSIEEDMTNAKLTTLDDAIDLFLRPLSAQTGYAVAQVVYLTDGTPSLATADGGWIETRNGITVDQSALLAMATGLGLPGEALIITRITYPYTPILSTTLSLSMPATITETALAKPRVGRPILFQ